MTTSSNWNGGAGPRTSCSKQGFGESRNTPHQAISHAVIMGISKMWALSFTKKVVGAQRMGGSDRRPSAAFTGKEKERKRS